MAFFQEFVEQQAQLVAEWLRVGYVHGNMNSENCLLCGQTLDYGPFAFMEGYLVVAFKMFSVSNVSYFPSLNKLQDGLTVNFFGPRAQHQV